MLFLKIALIAIAGTIGASALFIAFVVWLLSHYDTETDS